MSTAYFFIHGRLNDLLERDKRGKIVRVDFQGEQSVKHLAESLGAPHPEIGEVQVNGRIEALNFIAQDGDSVDLFPIPNGFDSEPRFLLDCHLGRLTAHLRALGFDCLYENDFDDPDMAEIVAAEGRILLTRDRRLLMRKKVEHGYCLRSLDSMEQLKECILRFDLARQIRPFHRCLKCNHPLEPVEKEKVLHLLEPLTKKYYDEFHQCPACGQVYWKGSHYDRMKQAAEKLRGG
ncbi:MAG: twitching motility protein PilT [Anaerolineales bacterium]|nr:twitching motility protein PilT [Anaerolineales bacterium]